MLREARARTGIAPAFSSAATSTGMRISCKTMPGIAVVKAPLTKAAIPKGLPAMPKKTAFAAPEATLPSPMAARRERYT